MRVLTAALISEGILLILALLGQGAFSLPIRWNASPFSLMLGVLLTIPALASNHLLWRYSLKHADSAYSRFSREVILPLCSQVTTPVAIVVAILSGICEEWFFRGTLNALCARYVGELASCIVTSALFAAIHFIGNFKRFGAMIPLYTLMGAYLWFAQHVSDSLAAAALLHGLYNFTVIMLVRRHVALREHVSRLADRRLHGDQII